MDPRALIVAPATPSGRSALAIVRLSGDLSAVRDRLVVPMRDAPWAAGRTRRVQVRDAAGVFDDGVAVWARAPRSYTGEDTLEIAVHGNPLIVERLLAACVDAGARLAEPGEFTRRAVLNGKVDLVQAEAVDQAVRASTVHGVALARAGLDGALGAMLAGLRTPLLEAAAELEARLDYPGDELARVDDARLCAALTQVAGEARALAATHTVGRRWVDGATVALVGPVNVGKSSLFNALVGHERALVHDTPGTTRDVVEARLELGGLQVTLLDTAGERATDDPVEAAGLALAASLVARADLLVLVLWSRPEGPDAVEQRLLEQTGDRPRVVVSNGIDLQDHAALPGAIGTSALRGDGLTALRTALGHALVDVPGPGAVQIASARQRDLLLAVARGVDDAVVALPIAGPAVAADALTDAIGEIDALTGADPREAVLDEVFRRFCIGK